MNTQAQSHRPRFWPRWTLRGMMRLVASLAVVCGGLVWFQRDLQRSRAIARFESDRAMIAELEAIRVRTVAAVASANSTQLELDRLRKDNEALKRQLEEPRRSRTESGK